MTPNAATPTMSGTPMRSMPMTGMPMPMMGGMLAMMCTMSMEMGKDGMVCKMMPAQAMTMEQMTACCEVMKRMMGMGMPAMMMCGGMCLMATMA